MNLKHFHKINKKYALIKLMHIFLFIVNELNNKGMKIIK